jgi:2-C-methyl-D-erythritol 4-phosphate cytidylyltransferase
MAATDKKISELEEAATLDGNESVPIVQGGENFKATMQAIADVITSNGIDATIVIDGVATLTFTKGILTGVV